MGKSPLYCDHNISGAFAVTCTTVLKKVNNSGQCFKPNFLVGTVKLVAKCGFRKTFLAVLLLKRNTSSIKAVIQSYKYFLWKRVIALKFDFIAKSKRGRYCKTNSLSLLGCVYLYKLIDLNLTLQNISPLNWNVKKIYWNILRQCTANWISPFVESVGCWQPHESVFIQNWNLLTIGLAMAEIWITNT